MIQHDYRIWAHAQLQQVKGCWLTWISQYNIREIDYAHTKWYDPYTVLRIDFI